MLIERNNPMSNVIDTTATSIDEMESITFSRREEKKFQKTINNQFQEGNITMDDTKVTNNGRKNFVFFSLNLKEIDMITSTKDMAIKVKSTINDNTSVVKAKVNHAASATVKGVKSLWEWFKNLTSITRNWMKDQATGLFGLIVNSPIYKWAEKMMIKGLDTLAKGTYKLFSGYKFWQIVGRVAVSVILGGIGGWILGTVVSTATLWMWIGLISLGILAPGLFAFYSWLMVTLILLIVGIMYMAHGYQQALSFLIRRYIRNNLG